eukprot:UN02784
MIPMYIYIRNIIIVWSIQTKKIRIILALHSHNYLMIYYILYVGNSFFVVV